jgi:hypothetical protein
LEADGALAGVEVDETGIDGAVVEVEEITLVEGKTGELDEAGNGTALVEAKIGELEGELDEAGGKLGDGPDFKLAPQTLPL